MDLHCAEDVLASNSCSSGSRKRKLPADKVIVVTPKSKFVSVNQSNHERRAVHLLDLSDEVLLQILINLDNYSVLDLMQTCTRLKRIALDRKLWIDVDFTSVKLVLPELIRLMKYLNDTTLSLCLTMNSLLHILEPLNRQCPQLERLEFSETNLSEGFISLKMFPKSLRSLSLRRCETNGYFIPFLHNIYKHLPMLGRVSITYCNWFDEENFAELAKLPNLKYLSLVGCDINESFEYDSFGESYGFPKLEKLDLRDTLLSDKKVSRFSNILTLKELLLECPEQLRSELDEDDVDDVNDVDPDDDPIITDRSICGIGQPNENNYIRPIIDQNSRLERLFIRHYELVTDISLEYLATVASNLKLLDVTGTSVTADGVRNYRQVWPNCTVISDFDNAVPSNTAVDTDAASVAVSNAPSDGGTGSPAPEDAASNISVTQK